MDFLKIEYRSIHDLGEKILYQNGFQNKVYLDVNVKAPTYPITESGEENGDGDFIPTFQKWQKRYTFTTYVPEFLADALTLLPLHDYVWITFQNNETNKVKDIEVETDWQDIGSTDETQSCFCKITISFAVDSIITIGCNNMEIL